MPRGQRSTGLPSLCQGMRSSSSSRRVSGKGANSRPWSSQASAAMIPKAPVAVATPRRGPAMGRNLRKARDTASSSTRVRTRMMPAAARARSTMASSPTREPVWDMAALAPARLRPVFKAMMGLLRATRAAVVEKPPPPLDAFQVQDDDAGVGIVRQIFQDIHHVQVAGVADVDGLAHPPGEGRGPHLEGPGLGHHGEGRRLAGPGERR